MKHLLPILLVCAALSGCHTTRYLPMPVDHIQHDTLFEVQHHYDSVHIQHDRTLDRLRDTIHLTDKVVEYRYKILHDTIRIVRVDSIPVIHQVPAEAPHRTRISTIIAFLAGLALLGLLCFVIILREAIRRAGPHA